MYMYINYLACPGHIIIIVLSPYMFKLTCLSFCMT